MTSTIATLVPLIMLAICIPLGIAYACLKVIAQISSNVAQGVTIKFVLEAPPPITYTPAPEQVQEDNTMKKVFDAAQAIQELFLDDDQMFNDKEVK